MQADAPEAPAQLTQVPPKPTCVHIFNTGTCADLWNAYNQAVQQRSREELQLYVNRQKAIASSQATAPLQQQIADLNKLVSDQQTQIKNMQEQMQADAATSRQQLQVSSASAHTQGLEWGAGIGLGVSLVLVGLVFTIRRLTRDLAITKKPQAKVASV